MLLNSIFYKFESTDLKKKDLQFGWLYYHSLLSAYVFKLFGIVDDFRFYYDFSIFTLTFFDVLNSSFLIFLIVHVCI